MIFKQIDKSGDWVVIDYMTTWNYGYDFILDASQSIIDNDFKDDLQRVAISMIVGSKDIEIIEEVRNNKMILRNTPSVKEENGTLTISGISQIMECPFQISFFNQTNVVRLFTPIKQLFENHGEHVFDNYMNSIEIKAYCKNTERNTEEKLRKEFQSKKRKWVF
ncbi:MAG TPA: hypothetical protein DC057_05260 [Spirochaetia bacterium]|nr:hypothetical protein [Spirochaetia bacterium]